MGCLGRAAVYDFIQRILVARQYGRLSKGQKGMVRRFLAKLTGLSRAQLTRLIGQWRKRGQIQVRAVRRHRFPCRYTRPDIALLDIAYLTSIVPYVKNIQTIGGGGSRGTLWDDCSR